MSALRVYVAGASVEVDMCAEFIGRLRVAGAVITHDWTSSVRANGGAADASMPRAHRAAMVVEDFAGIAAADVVWVLVPEAQTIGAWVELGYARGLRKRVHVSGPHSRRTIFTEFCAHHETHEDAFRHFAERARAALEVAL